MNLNILERTCTRWSAIGLLISLMLTIISACASTKNPEWIEKILRDAPMMGPPGRVVVEKDQHQREEYYNVSAEENVAIGLVFVRKFLYGRLDWEGWLQDGLEIGCWKGYHESGDLSIIKHYEHGRVSGRVVWWHEGGQLAGVMEYENGRPHGRRLVWHANGRLGSKGMLYGDNLRGRCTEWNEYGTIFTDRIYDERGEIERDLAAELQDKGAKGTARDD